MWDIRQSIDDYFLADKVTPFKDTSTSATVLIDPLTGDVIFQKEDTSTKENRQELNANFNRQVRSKAKTLLQKIRRDEDGFPLERIVLVQYSVTPEDEDDLKKIKEVLAEDPKYEYLNVIKKVDALDDKPLFTGIFIPEPVPYFAFLSLQIMSIK